MRSSITIISLLLNLILAGYIIYQSNNSNPNNTAVNFSELANLEGVTDEASLNDLLSSFDDVIEGITTFESINTKSIELEEAKRMHKYMITTRGRESKDMTRAVRFKVPVLLDALYQKTAGDANRPAAFLSLLLDTDMYCYLAKYDSDIDIDGDTVIDNTTDQSTIIIQLAKGNGDVFPLPIINMGSLCPKNCPTNENIGSPQ